MLKNKMPSEAIELAEADKAEWYYPKNRPEEHQEEYENGRSRADIRRDR